ncbi:sensor histidine kinase [Corynebacterium pacaense]|uniref:sensor histidine kinase n=1 Tax=Corynebacterium pacaense TaxID=1816684 RepID=UPI0009BA6797|nr:histidine kinase [Corynebacterium pacaense]
MRMSALVEGPWFASCVLLVLWLLSVGTVYFFGDGLVPGMGMWTLVAATTVVIIHAGVFMFRGSYPYAVFTAGVVAAALMRLLPLMQEPQAEPVNYGAMIFASYALLRHAAPRLYAWSVLLLGTVVLSVVYGVVAVYSGTTIVGGLTVSPTLLIVLSVVSAWMDPLVGALIAVIVSSSRALTAQHRRADVEAERTRIARELHDTTAHHLTAIAIQATAARAVFDRDPEAARASLERISTSASEALSEIRLTLGQLRGEEPAPMRPQPQLGDLPILLDQCRDLGMSISVSGGGLDPELTRAEQICAHQVLREALTNARRHAPGAQVEVNLHARGLQVLTIGRFSPAAEGRGTLGMTERAESVGATIEQGPVPGGWVVRLKWRIP